MVDIAATSAAAQTQVDRGTSQENTVSVKELLQKQAEDSSIERKEVESGTGPDVGQNVDVQA